MLFNSFQFLWFFPLVFAIYWFVLAKNYKWQNLFLLLASYYFYSCWDWRFTFLLMFSTLLDYFSGLMIAGSNSDRVRKFWFWLSISINLGFLGIFKYYNFFVQSFADLMGSFGLKSDPTLLNIVLPVGISFYTFHGLSYVIDIYKRRIEAERNFVDYGVFVSFFPLLVAGPIERATHLLPQIKKARIFEYERAVNGMKQILWGFFKKVVIADLCAEQADLIFSNYADQSGSTLLMGAIFFTFQIYGDFSGYSDIALGTARLLGIELLRNFSFPYFSRDIAEFWRRWHISLSSWFRDYVYIPLGGSRAGRSAAIKNTFIIFLVSGFWHGANWTFIVWGALNAVYFLPLLLSNKNRTNIEIVAEGKLFPTFKEFRSMVITFLLVVLGWIFFRSENVGQAFSILSEIFSPSIFGTPTFRNRPDILVLGILLVFFILVEWLGREGQFALDKFMLKKKRWHRWALYSLIVVLIGLYMRMEETPFIYFQF